MHVEVFSYGENACLFLQSLPWPESRKEMVDEGLERTIIFNPRVCNDIDLDIGKWIHIHPPWYDSCVCSALLH